MFGQFIEGNLSLFNLFLVNSSPGQFIEIIEKMEERISELKNKHYLKVCPITYISFSQILRLCAITLRKIILGLRSYFTMTFFIRRFISLCFCFWLSSSCINFCKPFHTFNYINKFPNIWIINTYTSVCYCRLLNYL